MIGTIRNHSGKLWLVIITATIVSFVYWGVGPTSRNGGGGGGGSGLGMVYGKKVTPDAYQAARKDFFLSYWFHSGNWPDKATMPASEIDRQVYLSIMLVQKAEQLGIHVSVDSVAASANERLQAIGRNGQVVTLDALVKQALEPEGLSAADFESYVRHDLIIQELIQTLGLPGNLVTPQEATAAYERENEELASQVVFFSATNYLASVKATPEIVGQFFTNYQAQYRLPDRVQINYVAFPVSNYLAMSKAEWAKTNLSDNVEAALHKVGETYRGSKSAAEARAKITDEFIEGRAQADAKKAANDFATKVFAIDPPKAENLALVANKEGLILHQTAPFNTNSGPEEFESTGTFTRTAFELTPDSPLAGPLLDGDVIYIVALAKTLPSVIPSYEQVRFRAALDYQQQESTLLARRAGMTFYQILTNQMAAGHSFVSTCVGAGHAPVTLSPFSISTQELPELGEHASLRDIKQTAFTTTVGKPSVFTPTLDGGFILYVQSKLPVDKTKLAADLPQFTQGIRRARLNEAFNEWLQSEAGSALNIPK